MGCGVVLGDTWAGPLDDGLEYREGSIASKELLKSSSGAVTAFAIDAGQGVGESSQPFDAMIHVLEGALTVTVDGKEHAVAAGQAVLIPALRPHALSATERCKIVLTMLRAS